MKWGLAVLLAALPLMVGAASKLDSATRYQIESLQSELLTFQERLHSQEATIDALRREVATTNQSRRDHLLGSASTLEERMGKINQDHLAIAKDLIKLQDLINACVKELNETKKRLSSFEKQQLAQTKNFEAVEKVMNSLASEFLEEPQSYTVQNGDCLGTIAKKSGKSIKEIMQANQMTNDKIVVGQKLLIP